MPPGKLIGRGRRRRKKKKRDLTQENTQKETQSLPERNSR
jgi:hypothetical protein